MTLAWPVGWPRTPKHERERGRFHGGRNDQGWGTRDLTVNNSINRVQIEVGRMGGTSLRIDTDMPTRNDGMPYSQARTPDDPGVVVSFRLPGGRPIVFPCDRFEKVAQNLAAIAATIAAKRAIERYGVTTLDREFEGYAALPSGDPVADSIAAGNMRAQARIPDHDGFDPYAVLEVTAGASPEVIRAAYKAQAMKHHPDRGGDPAKMADVNRAMKILEARQ